MTAMPLVGDDDVFESTYIGKLKVALGAYGLLINYEKDRAALDLGIHLYERNADGNQGAGRSRVWLQAKGKRAATLTKNQFEEATSVPVSGLPVEHVRYWYGAPEAVYLVVFIESVDSFLAADVRDIVDAMGGWQYLSAHSGQSTMTLHVPKAATLERAIAEMPKHRSMRIDGPSFRGRPLGHRYDPLRSELAKMPPGVFVQLVETLLDAYGFESDTTVESNSFSKSRLLQARFGTLTYTYEWVLPMFTEFGYDEGSTFRIEGAPQHAHGNVLIIVDADPAFDRDYPAMLADVLPTARERGISDILVFCNVSEGEIRIGTGWRLAAEGFDCWPQLLGSLAFSVLVTTNVYLEFLDHLSWNYVNYLY